MRRRGGFTLIELTVVVAIAGIVVSSIGMLTTGLVTFVLLTDR